MKLWIYSVVSCFLGASLGGVILAKYGTDDEASVLVMVGVLFFPLIIVATYGFRHQYFMGHRPGFIYRGFAARAMSVFTIVLYFAALGMVYLSDMR